MSTSRSARSARRRVADAVEKSRSALVVTHVRPDGDAVGSCIALVAILRAMRKTARARSLHPVPDRYAHLAGASWVTLAEPGRALPPADTVFALDAATLARTGLAESLPAGALLVNVDHHVSNGRFGDVAWIDGRASSTGEMLLELAIEREWPLPPAARDALYAAIYTDTGRFSYSNTSARTLELAARLVALGTEVDRLYRMIYCSRSAREIALEARARASLEMSAGGRVGIISLRARDFRECKATPLDAEDFPQIPMQIAGVEAGLFLYELESGRTKVSLRSAGALNVSRLAMSFGGGGHVRAAGCELDLPLGKTKSKVLASMRRALGPAPRSAKR